MKCPSCKETNLVMAERQGIEIDYCPDCRGVWLDRGELDKIIERTMPQTSAEKDPEPYSRHPHGRESDHRYKKKKRKSLLGELFDF